VYIGQTWQSLNQRFNEHTCKNSKCHKLKNAIDKYGKENFSIEKIASCDTQLSADAIETFWIRCYDSIKTGYNIREGGSKGKHSLETKEKISKIHKGKIISNEVKIKMSKTHIGMKLTPESIKKCSEARKAYWLNKRKVG
jgi:group I intron endonuclease